MSEESARSVQLAVFTQSSPEVDAQHLFESAFQRSPDAVHKHLRPLGPQQVLSRAEGVDAKAAQQVLVQANRVDFLVMPAAEGPGIPLLANGLEVATRLVEFARDRLHIKGVNRLALVIDFATLFDNLAEANAYTRRRLGESFPTDNDLDFLIQVNRRKGGTGPSEMNRLIKWASETVQQFSFVPPPGVSQFAIELSPLDAIKTAYLSAQMVDLNTVPIRETIDYSVQRELLSEMLDEMRWVRSYGGLSKWSEDAQRN